MDNRINTKHSRRLPQSSAMLLAGGGDENPLLSSAIFMLHSGCLFSYGRRNSRTNTMLHTWYLVVPGFPGFNGFCLCLLGAAMLPKRQKAGTVLVLLIVLKNLPSLFFTGNFRVSPSWAGDYESHVRILKSYLFASYFTGGHDEQDLPGIY